MRELSSRIKLNWKKNSNGSYTAKKILLIPVGNEKFVITGKGYDSDGEFSLKDAKSLAESLINRDYD